MDYGTLAFDALAATAKILFMILGFAMPLASILTWLERRQSAMMQDRLGPNRANIGPFRAWGITHFLADALKFLFKEDFVPPKAHKFLFMWAPIMAMAPALIVSAIVPFGAPLCWGHIFEKMGPGGVCESPVPLQIARLDAGLLFYFAIASLSVYGATLAGWASHNKWAMMGGLRASSQMISYEVTLGMSILGSFLVFGTLEPSAMVAQQTVFFDIHDLSHSWGIFSQPVGFLLFLTAAIAETKRTPFDIPEGEPEIIGYFVEYSGLRFGMFFLGEFLEIVFSSAIIVTVFLGGWHMPDIFGLNTFLMEHLPNIGFVLFSMLIWGGKVFLFCSFQLLIRWSLPRFRSDQLMRLGWQRLLPVSIANVVLTALVILYFQQK
ncbi:MAG: NADH-quinone oxidoreductase subunit [Myxococcales bacterium]|jgi:NADH-quinone oxidoreductase subunit H|nr:NADH-quinone oxidoreductase subunit [Myxococcales bacterium]